MFRVTMKQRDVGAVCREQPNGLAVPPQKVVIVWRVFMLILVLAHIGILEQLVV